MIKRDKVGAQSSSAFAGLYAIVAICAVAIVAIVFGRGFHARVSGNSIWVPATPTTQHLAD